jgi:hypothetical protein
MLLALYLKVTSFYYRYAGLLLLKTFLPQCPIEIFGENVISWMQQCLKSIDERQNKHALASTSCQVLSKKEFSFKLLKLLNILV